MRRFGGRITLAQRHDPLGDICPKGATREGRVLSCNRPSKPSAMKRSCQRQTQVFDLPVCRMISLVPTPAADRRTIWARHTCFWGLLRFAATAFRWRRMAGVTVRDIPVRIQQIHMPRPNRNPPTGFNAKIHFSVARSNQGGDDGDITLRPQRSNLLADR
jgi:hypothetical protein